MEILAASLIKKGIDMTFEKSIPLFFKGLKKYKDFSFKTEEEFGSVYFEYLEKIQNKYSNIKTLLYRNSPQNLYSFFEPMNLEYDGTIIHTKDTENIIRVNKKVFITGTGGIGKSMMMKHILLDTIKNENYIPIFIELKELNQKPNEPILNYIYESISQIKFNLTLEQFEYTLIHGRYLFLFDGLDELDPKLSTTIESNIKLFSDKYDNNNFIISSRPSLNTIGWNEFFELNIEGLSKKQALSLIDKLNFDQTIKKSFYKDLEQKLYESHQSFASIPLLLTIMLITYTDGGEIPNNLIAFYEQAYSALFYQHDASKSGFTRVMATKNVLDIEEFKKILSYIAFKSFFNSNVDITKIELNNYLDKYKENKNSHFINEDFINDAVQSVCLLVSEGNTYKFSHRSFQEYFSALYVFDLADSDQKNIFSTWIDSNSTEDSNNNVLTANSNFIDTLIYKQPNRTIENLLIPTIDSFTLSLEQDFNNNFDKMYFTFFKSFSCNPEAELGFVPNYFFDVFFTVFFIVTQNFNTNVTYKDLDIEIEFLEPDNPFSNNPKNKFFDESLFLSIELIKQKNELKEYFIKWCNSWIIPRYEFLLDWKEKYNQSKIKSKSNLKDLIDNY